MSNKEELQLLFGCFGRIDDGFISCRGCENNILSVDNYLDKYNDMMSYFDTCRLFDKPMFDYSAIRHFLHNMQDRFDQISVGRPLWLPTRYRLMEKFSVEHRHCGLYIKLGLVESGNIVSIEEKPIKIKSVSKQIELSEAPKLLLKTKKRSAFRVKGS